MATPNTYPNTQGLRLTCPPGRIVRTLVVDDIPGIRDLFSIALNQDPRINLVGTAADGLSAVVLAQATRPDLIFMDINMPRMNGLKAAMHIKARLPETKIILMSADDDPDIAFAAMDCGADGFLPKERWTSYGWHVHRLFVSSK